VAAARVINLNRYRKAKAKQQAEVTADRNRRLHGRTAAERRRDEQAKHRLEAAVDGAKLDPERPPED